VEENVEAILFSLHPLRKEIAAFLGAKGTGTDVVANSSASFLKPLINTARSWCNFFASSLKIGCV
jgi:hypothetical protein